MILKKMPGKVAKAALKFQFVKFKVGIDCLILGFSLHYENVDCLLGMIPVVIIADVFFFSSFY